VFSSFLAGYLASVPLVWLSFDTAVGFTLRTLLLGEFRASLYASLGFGLSNAAATCFCSPTHHRIDKTVVYKAAADFSDRSCVLAFLFPPS
jgi:hypothetical protein